MHLKRCGWSIGCVNCLDKSVLGPVGSLAVALHTNVKATPRVSAEQRDAALNPPWTVQARDTYIGLLQAWA